MNRKKIAIFTLALCLPLVFCDPTTTELPQPTTIQPSALPLARIIEKRQTSEQTDNDDNSPTSLLGLNSLLINIVGGLLQSTLNSAGPSMMEMVQRASTSLFSIDKIKADLSLLRRVLKFVTQLSSFLNQYLPVQNPDGSYSKAPFKLRMPKVTLYSIPTAEVSTPPLADMNASGGNVSSITNDNSTGGFGGSGGFIKVNEPEPEAATEAFGGGSVDVKVPPIPVLQEEDFRIMEFSTEVNESGGYVLPLTAEPGARLPPASTTTTTTTAPPPVPFDTYGLPPSSSQLNRLPRPDYENDLLPPTDQDYLQPPQNIIQKIDQSRPDAQVPKIYIDGARQDVVVRNENFDSASPAFPSRRDKTGLPAKLPERPYFGLPLFGRDRLSGNAVNPQTDGQRRKGELEETYGSIAEIPLERNIVYGGRGRNLMDSFGQPLMRRG